ncbi:MAG: phosphate ABC transporter substrate-binding protein [Synechococcaceae cyanobacterium SM2_3_1]|nr:phosphate ABC transporter substrate-binding protein [Synechococcaceae cyanobacterium SM2_3_1]
MSASKGPPPIVYFVIVALLGIGGWYGYQRYFAGTTSGSPSSTSSSVPTSTSSQTSPPAQAPPSQSTTQSTPPLSASNVDLQASVPDPTVLRMDGSVSMVKYVQSLRNLYGQRYPSIPTTYGIPDGTPNGSSRGLAALLNGEVQLAATSRPLKPEEATAGIAAIPVARDAIAVVVSVDNPFQGGLTLQQLGGIYQGQIRNWSEVGGPDLPLRILNRSPDGGTHDLFKNVVLFGQDFAPDGPNFKTFQQDVTTPILRELGRDGISYATVAHVLNQQTVRIVPIDGVSPTDETSVRNGTYPISRNVFLATTDPTSSAVKNFIELALSPQGQDLARRAELIPL